MKISPIPKTAPFAEDEIDILNRVVGPASATQRAWLAGFLAGLDAAHAAPQPAAPPQVAEPLTILYATESGNSERLANDTAKAARKQGLKPTVVDMADLELATLAKANAPSPFMQPRIRSSEGRSVSRGRAVRRERR